MFWRMAKQPPPARSGDERPLEGRRGVEHVPIYESEGELGRIVPSPVITQEELDRRMR
jgi:hypothetical protein